ncbi:MAG: helicase-exonuclease AddAB subunit AddA [Lachnospiraceae bacterium]|nr:helicase-exonuclease AddAB subunit AddA [Lachnospiraceae bacterium]
MPEWTPEQQKAIDIRDRNLLVSAAAGSGKTAVLVQRVIDEITDPDPEKQRDIDTLVIVTFTRASAAEMKERLRTRLQAMQQEDPDNEVLRRQLRLLPDAPICTIDSFCLKLVREHYTEIGLDPGFHTSDESESALLMADVLDAMFEEHYAADQAAGAASEEMPAEGGAPGPDADISFSRIAKLYGAGKDDRKLAECITMIWKTAQSFAWPDEWLAHCADAYDMDENQILSWGPVRECLEGVRKEAKECLDLTEDIRLLLTHPGADKYGKNVDDHEARLKALVSASDAEEIQAVLSVKPLRKASVRAGKNTDMEAAGRVSAWIDRSKAAEEAFGGLHLDSAAEDARKMRPYARKLALLTQEFAARFKEAKAERGILEFSDIEHYALQILTRRENGKTIYTPTADELAGQCREILIDEYQDSNRLQEEILNAVSRTRMEGAKNNITMVGDLKQSIYRFRQADPELFAEKSRSYPKDGEDFTKIMLSRNFRSRRGVIDSVNAVFSDVMSDAAGGTDYGEEEALQFGFSPYETAPKPESGRIFAGDDGRTEVYVIPGDQTGDGRQAQALLIAEKIRGLLAGGWQVYDAHEGSYRPLAKKDISVLVRSAAQTVPVLVRTLEDAGIDCYAESRSGFFSAWEIQQVVNLLQLIDNPLQDIPAAAVMLSFFGGFSADELTTVRLAGRHVQEESGKKRRQDTFLWMTVNELASGGGDSVPAPLVRKCQEFAARVNTWRENSRVLSVHDLVWELVCDTGFYRYAGTLKSGRRRTANLDSLLGYAAGFDQTGYHGLFQFLRYIGQIQASDEIAIGERAAVREEDDVVRIMTIHKSKGLEFPVVFVAEMGKDYKTGPENPRVTASREGGLTLKPLDESRRAAGDGLMWNIEKRRSEAEDKSEEMRLLYVAMTRAREKLILVGSVKRTAEEKKQGALIRWDSAKRQSEEGGRSAESVLSGKNYFDLVMPKVLALMEGGGKSPFVMEERPGELFLEGAARETVPVRNVTAEETGKEEAAWRSEPYPYPLLVRQKPKVSVSEIKRQMFEEEQLERAGSEADFLKEAARREAGSGERTVPRFLQTEKRYSAPARGTAYHRIMELIDFTNAQTPGQVKEQIGQMLADGKISQETADCVQYSKVAAFFATDLGKKAAQAAREGTLHREQPFLFERAYGGKMQPPGAQQDLQLVQGVIDLYFELDGQLYLVDYKTDRVKGAEGEKELRGRYQVQLDLYAQALEKAAGQKVAFKYIYSFAMMKELLS